VSSFVGRLKPAFVLLALSLDPPGLECAQQNRADENKDGAHRQHIQLQGKVQGRCLPCLMCVEAEYQNSDSAISNLRAAPPQNLQAVMRGKHALTKQLIARRKNPAA